jgi:hypothetical protein
MSYTVWNLTGRNKLILKLSGIPITSPEFWMNEDSLTEAVLRNVFRSATEEEIPLLHERLECLREAGRVLDEVWSLRSCNGW